MSRATMLVMVTAAGLLAGGPLRAGLVAHYDFEEGSGTTIADISGNGHTGAIQNASVSNWVAGRVGSYALNLDGVNQYATTLNSLASQLNLDGNKPKSVAFWAYTRTFQNGGAFDLGTGVEGHEFCLRATDAAETWRAQFYGNPDVDGRLFGCVTNWSHFVVVHDGTNGCIYGNGYRLNHEASTLAVDDGRALEIGRYNGNYYFNGIIDDLRIYDHALTLREIQALAWETPIGEADRVAPAFALDATARTNVQGFAVAQVRVNTGAVTTIAEADALLAGDVRPNGGSFTTPPVVNYGAGGRFTNDVGWIGGEQFAVRATGVLDIPAAGSYSFGVNSDDGFRLRIGKRRNIVAQFPIVRGTALTTTAVYFDQPGLYPLELTFFENGGGELLEFSTWNGDTPTPGTNEVLLGSASNGTVTVYQNILTESDRLAPPVPTNGAEFVSGRHVASNGYAVVAYGNVRQLLTGAVSPTLETRRAFGNINSGLPGAGFADNFAGEFTGLMNVATAGVHQFTVNSDDGFRLEIGAASNVVNEAVYNKGGSDVSAKVAFLAPGLYPFRLTWFEIGGAEHAELKVDGLQLTDAAQGIAFYPTAGAPYAASLAGRPALFEVTAYRATNAVLDLNTALRVLSGALPAVATQALVNPVVNFFDTGVSGNYGSDAAFPLNTAADDNEFVLEAVSYVAIPTNGFWTFGVNSDDGFWLEIGDKAVAEYAGARGPGNTLASVYFARAGNYRLKLIYFEHDGGAAVELFAARGLFTAFNATDFRLVGDTAAGGLAVYQTPAPPTPPDRRGTVLLVR